MKKFTIRNLALILASSACMVLNAQDNLITLTAAATGSEGETKYTDSSPLAIDEAGIVTNSGDDAFDDWTVAGNVTLPKALNGAFSLSFGGMVITNPDGATLAEMIAPRGIDRASSGQIGIRGGETNGIDANEGLYWGLDLSSLSSDISIQITRIKVQYLGDGETGAITSLLDLTKTITFSATGDGGEVELASGSGMVDISSFDIKLVGGSANAQMLTCYNNGTSGNFRIWGVELKVLDNTVTAIKDEVSDVFEFSFYPNPFSDMITINYKAESTSEVSVELFNLSGQSVLKNQSSSDQQIRLNTSELPVGIYFCTISDGMKTTTRKIIKK